MASLLATLAVCAVVVSSTLATPSPSPLHDACTQPADPGRCRGSVMRYFYESDTATCRPFTYGGCGGNENNFQSMADCTVTCIPAASPMETTPPSNTSGWGPWRRWTRCYPKPDNSETPCGPLSGLQKRRRSCETNGFCKGRRYQLRPCEYKRCKLQPEPWGPCSATCGAGRQFRRRPCQGPVECSLRPFSMSERVCKMRPCPRVHSCDRRPQPCHNGGVCIPVRKAFLCQCALGYVGPVCQYVQPGFVAPTRPAPRPTTEQTMATASETTTSTWPEPQTTTQETTQPEPATTTAAPEVTTTLVTTTTANEAMEPTPARNASRYLDCLARPTPEFSTDAFPYCEPKRHIRTVGMTYNDVTPGPCMAEFLRVANRPKSRWVCKYMERRSVISAMLPDNETTPAVVWPTPSRLLRQCPQSLREPVVSIGTLNEHVFSGQVRPSLPRTPECMALHLRMDVAGRFQTPRQSLLPSLLRLERFALVSYDFPPHRSPFQ